MFQLRVTRRQSGHDGRSFGAPPHVRDGLDDVDRRDDTHRRAAITLPQVADVTCQAEVRHPAPRRQDVGNAAERERKNVGGGVLTRPRVGRRRGCGSSRAPSSTAALAQGSTSLRHPSEQQLREEASRGRAQPREETSVLSLRRTELHPPAALGNALGKPLICGQQHRPRVRRSEDQRLSGRGPTSAQGSAAEIGGSGRRQRSAEGQRQARQGVSGCCGCG